jgi:8-amino-7-oxononanoate synthase
LGARAQILPVVVGGDREAVAAARFLQQRGFDVRAVRPPTVPEGTARLRISVNAGHEEEQLAALAAALKEAEARG